MRENNRNSIEKCRKKLPQFTTMNVIDGQAGLISYFSLIFYSLTIDNILNIIVLLILAGVSIATLTGKNGIITQAQKAKNEMEKAQKEENEILEELAGKITREEFDFTDIQLGWTLGNSLDAYGIGQNQPIEEYETQWDNPITTKAMIQKIKELGFDTILIPITWFEHIDDENNIDEAWMARVKEVVDYGIDSNLNVIINTHHDDKNLGLEKKK